MAGIRARRGANSPRGGEHAIRGHARIGGFCAGGATTSCVTDSRSLRAAAGVSLFWNSPIGPLRFNFATPLRRSPTDLPQRFDLTLATRF